MCIILKLSNGVNTNIYRLEIKLRLLAMDRYNLFKLAATVSQRLTRSANRLYVMVIELAY